MGRDVPVVGPAPVADDTADVPAHLNRYVLPRFGSYRLGRLPAEEIEEWLNDEIEQGLSPSSVHRHERTLRRMLQVAVDKQKIIANPCDRVQPPRVPKREMVFLDWDQVVLLAEAHQPRFRALIYVAADTGMRWSELIGLRRSKVDRRGRKIRVTEQLVQLEDGSFVRKEPKTGASVRSVSISEAMTALLAGYLREFCSPERRRAGVCEQRRQPDLVVELPHPPLPQGTERHWRLLSLHDLRHTSVALAIASGAHSKAIQARMGHSSINVTLDRYGHLFPQLDEAIAEAFGLQLLEAQRRRANNVIQFPR